MRKIFNRIVSFASYLWNGRWRWVLVVLGFILFIFLWTLPFIFLSEDSIFGEYWVFGYILGPFYALAIWQVVSEDEREVPLLLKIRQALLSGFNKLLFALIFFILYVLFVGTLNGEL